VADILGSLGAAVISSDRLGHELLRDPQVLATLRGWWGESILTPGGDVHRGAVALIVFQDQAELARLESLLHPRIAARREVLMEAYAADPSVKAIVLDTPKLYEAGVDALCDTVIFVDADRSECLRRLAESRGWTEEELNRRKNMQNPLDVKRAKADHVIVNNSGIGELRMQVERVFSAVVNSFA
jgi:dephospho-CoA kinase